MNYELTLKYRKILKQQFNAGKITEKEYLNSLESLREKKPKEEEKELTIINKIKNKIMKTLKTLTVVLVLGLTLLSCNKENIEPIVTPVVPPIEDTITDPVVTPVNDTNVTIEIVCLNDSYLINSFGSFVRSNGLWDVYIENIGQTGTIYNVDFTKPFSIGARAGIYDNSGNFVPQSTDFILYKNGVIIDTKTDVINYSFNK